MRKNLYLGLIACAALTMTGCSNDEISYDSSKQEAQAIQFDTYLGKNVQGRGTVLTSGEGRNLTNFGVFAAYSGQADFTSTNKMDFMHNQLVSYSESESESTSTWTYDPLKYWPTMKGDKISFFAYAPHSVNGQAHSCITPSGNAKENVPTLTVEYPEDLKNMVDLVADVKMNQTKAGVTEDKIAFTLKHETTRVSISANVSEEVYNSTNDHKKTKVVIKSIDLKANGDDSNFYGSGTYTFASTNDATGTWSGTPQVTNLSLASILNTVEQNIGNDGYKYTTSGVVLDGTSNTNLFKTNEYLFLVPASAASAGGLSENKAVATIQYDIVTEDNNLEKGYSLTEATKVVYLPKETLKQGTAYTFLFTIKVNEIKVSSIINTWTEPGNTDDQDVPYTPDDVTKN